MRTLSTWRRAAIAGVTAGACAVSIAAMGPVVAEVGSHRITDDAVRAEIARLRSNGDLASALKTMTADGRRQIVEGMVRDELLAQAGSAAGLELRPEVQEAIARATRSILADAYRQSTQAEADVSEPALRRYFDAHAAEFSPPARVRARHILLATRADAEAVQAQLASGAAFADLARSRSIDPSTRDQGGELGWISRGVMVKPFEDALFALAPGRVGDIVESGRGFHLIEVEQIDRPAAPSFESVRDAVADRVRQAHLALVLERLRADYPVTIFPDALKALER